MFSVTGLWNRFSRHVLRVRREPSKNPRCIGTTCTPLATSAPASAAEGRGTPHRSTPAGRVCQRHLCYVLSVRNAIWMLLRRRNHEWCRYVPSSQSADAGSVFYSCAPMLRDKNTWVENRQNARGCFWTGECSVLHPCKNIFYTYIPGEVI